MNEIPSEQRKKFYEKSIKDDKNFGEKLIYTLENLDELLAYIKTVAPKEEEEEEEE